MVNNIPDVHSVNEKRVSHCPVTSDTQINDTSVGIHDTTDNQLTLADTVKLFGINNQSSDDKFITAVMQNNGWRKQIPWLTKNCPTFSQWRDQTDFDFGFIPLAEFLLPHDKNIDYDGPTCPIQQHWAVKEKGGAEFHWG